MKKLSALILVLSLVFCFASCGAKTISEPIETVKYDGSTASTTAAVRDEEESSPVVSEECTGIFEITEANNPDVDLASVFGSEIHTSGAEMTIGSNGYFDFTAGTAGGNGSIYGEGNSYTAIYNDYQEGNEHTISLEWNPQNKTYTMTYEGLNIVWSIKSETSGTELVTSGTYLDVTSGRATATVTSADDAVGIKISWADSASEAVEWTMTATLNDDGQLEYSDCRKSNVITNENGTTYSEVSYTDGKGYFELIDGKLLWTGAAESSCRECVFELQAN